MEPEIPATVGRYRIVSELGRGAMGAVYRAVDPKLDRTVAIKTIISAMTAGDDREEILARFEREARVSARLQHPNVVAVYDVGAEGDQLYLVMELVEGESLGQRLAKGRFPNVQESLEMIAQAAEALGAAHEAGIIHRDVKPGNLMLTKQGKVKVADFGVAKAVGEKMELTRTGMMVGSPAYMSPEQVKGAPLDGRSDLFSLGVVLYEMILHRKPFPADTVTTLVYQILHEDPLNGVPIPDALSDDLADFLRWTLAKDPVDRIPDGHAFAQRARAIAAGQPIVHPESFTPTTMMPVPGSPQARTAAATRAPAAAGRPDATARAQGTTVVEAPKSKLGLFIGIAAVVLVGAGLAFWKLGAKPAEPAAQAADATTQAPQVQVADRPSQTPSAGAAEPDLQISVPDVNGDVQPPEASGDGMTQSSAPKTPATTVPKPPKKEKAAPKADAAAAKPPANSASSGAAAETSTRATATPGFEVPQAVSEVYEARRAAQFNIRPDNALITINGVAIGRAEDWGGGTFGGGGRPYPFRDPGTYYVEFKADGYQTTWIKIVIRPDAKDLTVRIRTKLPKQL
jgi:serine/threonine-protein kinase